MSIAQFKTFCKQGYRERKYWSEQGWKRGIPPRNPRVHGGAMARIFPSCKSGPREAGRHHQHPVVSVSWYEADAYCRWRGGALPSEAQWERAACGGKPGPYPWGAEVDKPARWSTRVHPTETMTVATVPVTEDPNPSLTGIKHAAGNVWEWTADWYHRDAYSTASSRNPQGPETGTWKTLRGGSFANLPSFATCTHREPAAPAKHRLTAGFRCAYPMP